MTDIPLPGFGNLFISTCPGHFSALASWGRYSAPSHAVRCGLERPDFQVGWVMTVSSFVGKARSFNLNLQWHVAEKRENIIVQNTLGLAASQAERPVMGRATIQG